MKLYKIVCTFQYLGTKDKAKKWLNKDTIKFEQSDYIGKANDHHSGIFSEYFGVDNGESLRDVLKDYLYHNRDIAYKECYSVYDRNDKLLLTEEDNIKTK